VRNVWIAALLVASGIVVRSAAADPSEDTFLIVAGAADVREVRPTPIVRQIYYTLSRGYPERGVGEAQWRELQARGWVRCRSVDPRMEAANKDWVDFQDLSVVPNRTIHQHLTHWLKDDRLITVMLRYYSAAHAVTPDNTTQRIVVDFHERGREGAEWLKLDCS
jgi:hypothetical protein